MSQSNAAYRYGRILVAKVMIGCLCALSLASGCAQEKAALVDKRVLSVPAAGATSRPSDAVELIRVEASGEIEMKWGSATIRGKAGQVVVVDSVRSVRIVSTDATAQTAVVELWTEKAMRRVWF